MEQAPKLTKGQHDMLDWIGRSGPVLKVAIIRKDQMRAVKALLQAGYIGSSDGDIGIVMGARDITPEEGPFVAALPEGETY